MDFNEFPKDIDLLVGKHSPLRAILRKRVTTSSDLLDA